MKKYVFPIALLVLIAMPSSPVFAFGSGQGVKNSPHDFATDPWNSRIEICRVCHVPHDHGLIAARPWPDCRTTMA